MTNPTDCIVKDFDTRWYKKWSKKIGYPVAKHPKFWESAIMVQMLKERKALKKNKHAVVFGVGTEQLASLFADMSIFVTATDQDPDSEEAKKWDNGQLAKNTDSLFYPDIVSREKFDKYVTYKSYDMNKNMPSFYNKFDFIWHNCVVGHIGSMKKSLKHLEGSAKYIKKGGWLVFTTELNISSFDKTIDKDSDTIVWRLQDLENMFEKLAKVGLKADRFNLRLGSDKEDTHINYDNGAWMTRDYSLLDNPNYSEIKIAFANYAITQIVLSFKKTTPEEAAKILPQHKKDMLKNAKVIKDHIAINRDLADYYTIYNDQELAAADIVPLKRAITIRAGVGDSVPVSIKFSNNSKLSVFGFGPHWPMNHGPLVLATSAPINRNSIFASADWSSTNRPAIVFKNRSQDSLPKELNQHKHKAIHGDIIEYNFSLDMPKKAGKYKEKFILVFEGRGIVSKSEVELKIISEPKKPQFKDKKIVSPAEYMEIIKWDTKTPENGESKAAFLLWLKALANDSFRIRTELHPDEFEVFAVTYLRDNNYNIKKFEEIKNNIRRTYDTHKIMINDYDDYTKKGEPIYFVISTPRSGNTAITEALSIATGISSIAGNLKGINFSRVNKKMFIKTHINYSNFKVQFKSRNDFKVITITRNPLDSLLSAFRFSQKTAGCSIWLDGKVFPKAFMYKGKTPISSEFQDWALGPGAEAFLEVTESWFDKADVVIRYEEFIKDPERTITKAIEDLGLIVDAKQIKSGAKEVKDNFLVGYHNEHRWSGGMDNWQKYLPKETAQKIYKKHKKVFDKYGYTLEYPVEYSEEEIENNNKNWT